MCERERERGVGGGGRGGREGGREREREREREIQSSTLYPIEQPMLVGGRRRGVSTVVLLIKDISQLIRCGVCKHYSVVLAMQVKG